jgi:hypothetical protein
MSLRRYCEQYTHEDNAFGHHQKHVQQSEVRWIANVYLVGGISFENNARGENVKKTNTEIPLKKCITSIKCISANCIARLVIGKFYKKLSLPQASTAHDFVAHFFDMVEP